MFYLNGASVLSSKLTRNKIKGKKIFEQGDPPSKKLLYTKSEPLE